MALAGRRRSLLYDTQARSSAASSLFKSGDVDGSGGIDMEELPAIIRQLCDEVGAAEPSEESIGKIVRLADRDGNGVLDFGEFLVLEQKKRAL